MKGAVFSRLICGFCLAVVLLPVLFTGSVRAEPVRISVAARDDFGRIVFAWDNPVSHRSTVKGGRVAVHFGRPIEASFGRITRALKKYVKSVNPGEDGQSLILNLTGDFDVYSFDSGSSVIVEIADKKSSADGEKATKELAPEKTVKSSDAKPVTPGGKLLSIRVRTGKHANYTRLVFDWPNKVDYKLKQDGAIATVTFDRAASINLKALTSGRLAFIGGARATVQSKQTSVTLSVPATSKVRHFRSGPKVVVDIRRPSGSQKAAPLPPPAPTAIADKKTETAAKVEKTPDPAKVAKPAEPAKPAAKPATKTAAKPATKTAEIDKTTVTSAEKTAALVKTGKPAALGAGGIAKTAGSVLGKPTRLTPLSEKPKTSLPPLPPTPSQASVESKPSGPPPDAVTLRFDWDEPVGAAIFRRAGILWVAFDKPTAIDVAQLREAGKNIIKGIEQMGTTQGTVLRLSTVAGINPSVRRDGLAWLLDFRKQQIDALTPLTVQAQPDSPVGARLFAPVAEPGKPIGITDPEVGDNLVIVPLLPLGHGMGLEYVYPQVRFLASSQGLVIKPLIDDIRVRPLREGVEITSGGELKISAVSAEAEANRQKAAQKPLSRILKLQPWKVKNISAFLPRKYQLLYAVSKSKNAAREAARLDLVRFYLSNGYHAEALAILREAARTRPEIEQNPEYRMLRGGSKFMLGRYVEADKDFVHDDLRFNDEVAFWRASTRAAVGDITAAAPVLKRTGQIIRPYPNALKIPMGQLIIDAALKVGDIKQARYFLEILRLDTLSPEETSQLDYEEGRALELSGDFDAAVAMWETVRDGPHRPSQAKAVVARMELLTKRKQIPRIEAIRDLEGVRFGWRGDNFEFKLLRRLGTLYLEEGLYRKGLDRLRQAATYFRTHPEAPQVTLQMSDAFSAMYLDDAADALPPVTAIALYDEFKELTPAGVQGDEMIRKLADRLVGVDLLDRAVGLLSSQVRYRLQGVEKARVGGQLTLVHILDRNFTAALKVLDETETPNLPEVLALQRLHIRARILMGLKQGEAALAVLKGDKSRDAELLRTEVYWDARNWSKASQSLGNLIRESQAKPGKPLDDKQASYVLNYAIALTLSGNDRALDRARIDYTASMATGSLADAFNLIVAPSSQGLLSPELVKSRVQVAEKFQTFMAAYRARLKKENLSDLVPGIERPISKKKKPGGAENNATPDGNPAPSRQPATDQPVKPPPQV